MNSRRLLFFLSFLNRKERNVVAWSGVAIVSFLKTNCLSELECMQFVLSAVLLKVSKCSLALFSR